MTNSIEDALLRAERLRVQKERQQALDSAIGKWREPGDNPPPQEKPMAQDFTPPAPVPNGQHVEGTTPPPATPTYSMYGEGRAPVSEAVFHTVRQNAGIPRATLIEGLAALGYNKNSVSSLLAQFRRAKMIRFSDEDGIRRCIATVVRYRTPKSTEAYMKSIGTYRGENAKARKEVVDETPQRVLRAAEIAQRARRSREALDKDASRPDPTPPTPTATASTLPAIDFRHMSADDIVSGMTVVQARDVRRLLNDMFDKA